jgi:hypothetical protein
LDGSWEEEDVSAGVAPLAAASEGAGSVAGATSEFAAGADVDVAAASAWASMPVGGVASASAVHAQAAAQGENARAAEPTSPTIHDQGTRMLLISIDPPRKASMDDPLPPCGFLPPSQAEPRKPVNVSEKEV